jgi:hypothetical protein
MQNVESGNPRCASTESRERHFIANVDFESHRHPAVFPYVWLRGRSPGLQVLIYRLPEFELSGMWIDPHLLTVAGAAQELRIGFAHLFPCFTLPVEIQQRHLTTGLHSSLKVVFLPVGLYSACVLKLLIYFEKMRLAIDHNHFFKR